MPPKDQGVTGVTGEAQRAWDPTLDSCGPGTQEDKLLCESP